MCNLDTTATKQDVLAIERVGKKNLIEKMEKVGGSSGAALGASANH